MLALLLISCQQKEGETKNEEYFFENNGVRIFVGDDTREIISKLGKPNRESRAPSCAGVGEDIIYIYDGFRLLAYSEKSKETVVSIELTSDAVSTPEGIGLGDGAESVLNAYGVPMHREEGIFEYESRGIRLRFAISDGVVKSIKYLK